jgi:hypothetical protein
LGTPDAPLGKGAAVTGDRDEEVPLKRIESKQGTESHETSNKIKERAISQ